MTSNEEEPKLRATTAGQLFDWGYKIVDTLGLHQAMQGNSIGDLIEIKMEFSDGENDNAFAEEPKVKLSPLEALSFAYLSTYYAQIGDGYDYRIGFEMEDAYKDQDEEMLSDGLLMQYSGDKQVAIIPLQETKAIGIFQSDKRSIEDIIIEVMNKKITRRSTYPKVCGLVLSILPSDSHIDYGYMIQQCDIASFDVVFAMEYVGNDLRTCAVHDLIKLKNNPTEKLHVSVLSPKLEYH